MRPEDEASNFEDRSSKVTNEAEQIVSEESAEHAGRAIARYWRGLSTADDMPDDLRTHITAAFAEHYMAVCWPTVQETDE